MDKCMGFDWARLSFQEKLDKLRDWNKDRFAKANELCFELNKRIYNDKDLSSWFIQVNKNCSWNTSYAIVFKEIEVYNYCGCDEMLIVPVLINFGFYYGPTLADSDFNFWGIDGDLMRLGDYMRKHDSMKHICLENINEIDIELFIQMIKDA